MKPKNYLDIILNPLDLLRTKKVLHVNPTLPPVRQEPAEIKIIVYDFGKDSSACHTLKSIEETFEFLDTHSNSWINIDGLKKKEVEQI